MAPPQPVSPPPITTLGVVMRVTKGARFNITPLITTPYHHPGGGDEVVISVITILLPTGYSLVTSLSFIYPMVRIPLQGIRSDPVGFPPQGGGKLFIIPSLAQGIRYIWVFKHQILIFKRGSNKLCPNFRYINMIS
jgi:hypothetical protein